MKSIAYNSIIFSLLFLFLSCEDSDENDVTLPKDFYYASFEESSLNVLESDAGPVKVKFTYSGVLFEEDLTINYTITYPGERAATEGVDFILPPDSGSFVLPAGESSVEVILIESLVDNDLSEGTKTVSFNLEPVNNLLLGKPDDKEAKSVIVNIGEDDLFEFAYTSFEEVPAGETIERYPRPAASGALVNIQESDPASQAPYVEFVSAGNELGFTAFFQADAVDEIEDEWMGVYSNGAISTNSDAFETLFVDGSQGYITSDLDGALILTSDEVTGLHSEVTNVVLDVKVFFKTSTWESNDGIEIFFETEDGRGDPLLALLGDDAENLQGAWQDFRIPMPDNKLKTGKLVIVFYTNQPSEMILLDLISIKGIL